MTNQKDMFSSIKYEPTTCLSCGSGAINSEPFEVDGASAWRKVECDECRFIWKEIFECENFYNTCPECFIPNIRADRLESEELNIAVEPNECNECGETWEAEYKFSFCEAI